MSAAVLLNATAWQPVGDSPSYPEVPLLRARSNSGIAFSGGGTRAYTAALGQLAALHQLGLLEELRYITGISGGSWATAVYSYAQLGADGVAPDDNVLLGPLSPPENLTNATLAMLDERCARWQSTTGPLPGARRLRESARTLADLFLPFLRIKKRGLLLGVQGVMP